MFSGLTNGLLSLGNISVPWQERSAGHRLEVSSSKTDSFGCYHYANATDHCTLPSYNHGQKSLGQSERNFNSMRLTISVAKSSAVFLQIHVPSPLPTQYNVERSKELCLDGFNTVCGVGGGGREVQC